MSSFRDVLFTPISINQLIKSSIDLVNKEVFGSINISSNESVSKYDFHRMVLNSLDLDTGLLKAVSIDDFPHLVKRPKNMSLDNAKLRGISDLKIPSIYDMIIEEISFNH
jgi:dTDP-4-dehydrorhamnose reductase